MSGGAFSWAPSTALGLIGLLCLVVSSFMLSITWTVLTYFLYFYHLSHQTFPLAFTLVFLTIFSSRWQKNAKTYKPKETQWAAMRLLIELLVDRETQVLSMFTVVYCSYYWPNCATQLEITGTLQFSIFLFHFICLKIDTLSRQLQVPSRLALIKLNSIYYFCSKLDLFVFF